MCHYISIPRLGLKSEALSPDIHDLEELLDRQWLVLDDFEVLFDVLDALHSAHGRNYAPRRHTPYQLQVLCHIVLNIGDALDLDILDPALEYRFRCY